jgi:hypothetical protein
MKYLKLLPIFFLVFLVFLTQAKGILAAGVSLSFSPASGSVIAGDTFDIEVVLETGGAKTDGVDLLISYDDLKLETKNAVLGDLYDNKINVDVSQPGKIVLQAVSDAGSSFAGTGTLAVISFRAVAGGLAPVSFEMEAGSYLDCNVNYEGKDILTSVSNGAYTVFPQGAGGEEKVLAQTTTGTPTPTTYGTPTPTTYLTPTPTGTLPATGFFEPTVMGAAFGGLLILVALSLLVFL